MIRRYVLPGSSQRTNKKLFTKSRRLSFPMRGMPFGNERLSKESSIVSHGFLRLNNYTPVVLSVYCVPVYNSASALFSPHIHGVDHDAISCYDICVVSKNINKTIMTVKEQMAYIGQTGTVVLKGLVVQVEVMDIKSEFGLVRYLVKPVAGSGEVWIENVEFPKKTKS